MTDTTDHDLLIEHDVKLDNIKETAERIENKMDSFVCKLAERITWKQFAIVMSIIGIVTATIISIIAVV